MNGIAWWYFYKTGGPLEGRHPKSVDPGGRQWSSIGPQRAIGCVVDPACEVIAPGVIAHHQFNRFIIGEPDGSRTSRVEELSKMLTAAGFPSCGADKYPLSFLFKLCGAGSLIPVDALQEPTPGPLAL